VRYATLFAFPSVCLSGRLSLADEHDLGVNKGVLAHSKSHRLMGHGSDILMSHRSGSSSKKRENISKRWSCYIERDMKKMRFSTNISLYLEKTIQYMP